MATLGLFLAGALGLLAPAWGYGLFLVSAALLGAGLWVFCLFVFSGRLDGAVLITGAAWMGGLGALSYVLGTGALMGFFLFETVHGRMELRWILFGPAVIAAMAVLDWGIYAKVVRTNLLSLARYRRFLDRRDAEPALMRRRFLDEVVLHRTLLATSGFRWLKHTLILWGFALMVVAEGIAVCLREAFPALGWGGGAWAAGHPLRLSVDFAFDLSGLMMLVGCVMALAWRVVVQGRDEQKYTDTPAAAFLLAVVFTGFLVEGMRLAAMAPPPDTVYSFVGYALAVTVFAGLEGGGAAYETLWIVHMALACLFIAYVPMRRLIHSCATPIGRLMLSQKALLEARRRGVFAGLLGAGAEKRI